MRIVALAILVLLATSHARPSLAQQSDQATFPSVEAASSGLYSAVQHNDEQAVTKILGGGKELVSAGDAVLDKLEREQFAQKYREMHRLVAEPDGTTLLYIGAENWPFPIPLVSVNGGWHFHSETGAMEVLFRRIGENELTAIEASHALVTAEKQYKTKTGDHSARQYAQRIAGAHDGLFQRAPGAADGAFDALLANAGSDRHPVPLRGYFFRILTRQGKDAAGGAKSYIADGKMTGGFAVVAYPAEYRASGVMTFIVGEDDIVYEKDLGLNTASLAKAMTTYDPGPGWKRVAIDP
jgi:hypothetical protein